MFNILWFVFCGLYSVLFNPKLIPQPGRDSARDSQTTRYQMTRSEAAGATREEKEKKKKEKKVRVRVRVEDGFM